MSRHERRRDEKRAALRAKREEMFHREKLHVMRALDESLVDPFMRKWGMKRPPQWKPGQRMATMHRERIMEPAMTDEERESSLLWLASRGLIMAVRKPEQGHFLINWLPAGRKPTQQSNPQYPDGVMVNAAGDAPRNCRVDLPYPAEGCGVYQILCKACDRTALITAAGRPDDPRAIILGCKKEAEGADDSQSQRERHAGDGGGVDDAARHQGVQPER